MKKTKNKSLPTLSDFEPVEKGELKTLHAATLDSVTQLKSSNSSHIGSIKANLA